MTLMSAAESSRYHRPTMRSDRIGKIWRNSLVSPARDQHAINRRTGGQLNRSCSCCWQWWTPRDAAAVLVSGVADTVLPFPRHFTDNFLQNDTHLVSEGHPLPFGRSDNSVVPSLLSSLSPLSEKSKRMRSGNDLSPPSSKDTTHREKTTRVTRVLQVPYLFRRPAAGRGQLGVLEDEPVAASDRRMKTVRTRRVGSSGRNASC